jgi:ABC-type transport system involved in multi-copper enzyme maturation permease subunit
MTFLPIVQRELRVASRRRSTYWLRFATGLAATLIGGMAFLMSWLPGGSSGIPSGVLVFYVLSYYLFGLCLLAGIVLAADCLSEERREGTLGLLFLTDLKGYDVVLGKLLAVSLNAFYALLAVFPILGLSLVAGGVEGVEFGRVCLALLNALWFSTTLALWASSRSESGSRSMALTALLLMLLGGLLPGLISAFPDSAWTFHIASISPIEPFYYAQAANFWHQGGRFWSSLAISFLAGGAFLALASWRLARNVEVAPVPMPASAWQRFFAGDALFGKRQRRMRLLDINPVWWLVEDSPRLLWVNWALCVMGSLLMIACTAASGMGGMLAPSCASPFYLVLKILFALQACRFFSETRRNGMLDVLCTAPLTSQSVIQGQWLALRRLFLWPVAALMSVELLCLSLSGEGGSPASAFGFLLISSLFSLPTTVASFFALGWFGIWIALTGKRPQSAAGLTILLVAVLPAFAFCVPTLLIDIVFIMVCRGKLRQDFRLLLAANKGTIGASPDYGRNRLHSK